VLKRVMVLAVVLAGSIGLALAAAGPANYQGIWGAGLHGIGAVMGCDGASPQDCALGTMFVDSTGNPLGGDVCQNPNIAKKSAVINIGAAATTKIVDVSGTKAIFVCDFHVSLAGTTPSITWKYGTHVTNDCDTGATALSGTILPTSGAMLSFGPGSILMSTPASQQLCGTTAGTGSSAQGVLTYVQQ
jgi:hypothetical protein